MALTKSKMMDLGFVAPDFELTDIRSNQAWALNEADTSKGLLVTFMCNHCPYVKHILKPFVDVSNRAVREGLAVVAISSNDPKAYPEDAPEKMKALATQHGFNFPYLFDETQKVALDYGATCTPDFFLFNAQKKCVYRGQFDDARPGTALAPTGESLQAAITRLLAGEEPLPASEQRPSVGCNIKWI